VLAGAIDYFRYLKVGLSFVLVFIGVKMLLDPHGHPPRGFNIKLNPITRCSSWCDHHPDRHGVVGAGQTAREKSPDASRRIPDKPAK
jgi:hypothetical protein